MTSFKNIKFVLALTIGLASASAPAHADSKAPGAVVHSVNAPEKGTKQFRVRVLDMVEPIFNPFHVVVTVNCGDGKWKNIAKIRNVCDFDEGHEFDQAEGLLTLRMAFSEAEPGEAKCNRFVRAEYSFEHFCK